MARDYRTGPHRRRRPQHRRGHGDPRGQAGVPARRQHTVAGRRLLRPGRHPQLLFPGRHGRDAHRGAHPGGSGGRHLQVPAALRARPASLGLRLRRRGRRGGAAARPGHAPDRPRRAPGRRERHGGLLPPEDRRRNPHGTGARRGRATDRALGAHRAGRSRSRRIPGRFYHSSSAARRGRRCASQRCQECTIPCRALACGGLSRFGWALAPSAMVCTNACAIHSSRSGTSRRRRSQKVYGLPFRFCRRGRSGGQSSAVEKGLPTTPSPFPFPGTAARAA